MSSVQTHPADSNNNVIFNRSCKPSRHNLHFQCHSHSLPPLSEPDLRRSKANPLLAAGESDPHTLVLSQQIRR